MTFPNAHTTHSHGAGAAVRRALAVTWKDLLAEGRSRSNVLAVILFAGTALLLFAFALGPDVNDLRRAGAGVIWLTLFLSGILVFNRSYQVELEGGALEALLSYPGSRRPIFVGKLLANLVIVLLVATVVLPLAAVLFHVPLGNGILGVIAILLAGCFGFVTLGTFYAAMSSRSRARDVLLPLLLFPMLVPLLLAAVQGTGAFLEGDGMGYGGAWLRLILAFDLVFLTATLWAFEYIVGD
ncbi:MAG: heme exporter protein CcmB [Gemmatimonadota bacterium]